jgi:hypothetical protein
MIDLIPPAVLLIFVSAKANNKGVKVINMTFTPRRRRGMENRSF